MPQDDLKHGFREYISFTLKESVTQYSLARIFQDIQLGPEDYQKRRSTFDNMTQFGRDLAKSLDIDLEMADCKGQIESTQLYRQLIHYSHRRQNFADALRFLRIHAGDVTVEMAEALEEISDKFDLIASQWFKMGMLLIKISLTKKKALCEQMGNVMEQIARKELDLLRDAIDIGRMA